jgi:hypothetical protein
MEPIITPLDITKTLLHPIIVNGETLTEVHLTKLILRPVLKRIVFTTNQLDRTIVYEGETEYNAHKDDSQNTLIDALLVKIDTTYPHA